MLAAVVLNLIVSSVVLAVILAQRASSGEFSLDQLSVTPDEALTSLPMSKSEIEAQIYDWVKEDESTRNVSRDDVRVVLDRYGRLQKTWTSGQKIAHCRDVDFW
jgi:type IV pilus biogenesis protein CpaD/CtpE